MPHAPQAACRILLGEPGFPAVLARAPQPARVLWYRGRLPDPAQPALAIVGARAATLAGCRKANELARAVAVEGFAVISGGALGIDAAAHRGALDAAGTTFAVLGCGVDVVYPDRHVALFAEIGASGGLLSEYPPGTPPRGRQFPVRNRLVVALADAVLVVEAKEASGALVTARLALEAGRPLLAIPGSPGANGLIAAGDARAVSTTAELLRALGRGGPDTESEPAAPPPDALRPLMEALAGGSARPEELARRLGHSLPETLALVAEAELDGWICRRPGGALASLRGVVIRAS